MFVPEPDNEENEESEYKVLKDDNFKRLHESANEIPLDLLATDSTLVQISSQ